MAYAEKRGKGAQPCITVAVFRRVAALLLSVMSWVAEGVTFGHLLPAGTGYPVPSSSRVL